MLYDEERDPLLEGSAFTFRWPEAEPVKAPKAEPEYIWEGPMRGERGSAAPLRCTLVLNIRIREGQVTGAGHSPEFPYDCEADERQVEIAGASDGSAISMTITFPNSYTFKRRRFEFSGKFSADGKQIQGHWTYACEDCTCAGAGGALTLERKEA